MKCNCLNKIDEKLKEKGMKLSSKLLMFQVTEPDLGLKMVAGWPLERLDGKRMLRKDPKVMQMSHCPFCGVVL